MKTQIREKFIELWCSVSTCQAGGPAIQTAGVDIPPWLLALFGHAGLTTRKRKRGGGSPAPQPKRLRNYNRSYYIHYDYYDSDDKVNWSDIIIEIKNGNVSVDDDGPEGPLKLGPHFYCSIYEGESEDKSEELTLKPKTRDELTNIFAQLKGGNFRPFEKWLEESQSSEETDESENLLATDNYFKEIKLRF